MADNNPVPPPAPFPQPNDGQSNIPPPPPNISVPPPPPPVMPVTPPPPPPPPMPNPVPPPPPSMPVPPPVMPQMPPPTGGVQPPPPPEIGIRTMDSDLKSMQSSGGSGAAPQTYKPEELFSRSGPAPVMQIPPAPSGPGVKPAAPAPMGTPTVKVIGPHSSSRKIWILSGVIIALLAIWGIVQFVVLPAINAAPPPAKPVPVSTSTPVATTTQSVPMQPVVPPLVHQSFFATAVSPSTTVWLSAAGTLAQLQAAIASSTSPVKAAGTFEQLAFAIPATSSTTTNTPVTAQALLQDLLPNASSTSLTTTFGEDVTGFVYYNKYGAWPGYVFQLASTTSLQTVTSTVDPLVEANAANFFLTNPGTIIKSFADGALPSKATVRYATFTNSNGALEYGWFDNFLVISTSYQGIIDAEQHL